MSRAIRFINAVAPTRVCDIGGWTDTWFAGHGAVCNVAVTPCVEVQAVVRPRAAGAARVVLDVADYGDRYAIIRGSPLPGRHPLLEAAVDEAALDDDVDLEVTVHSDAPAGASMGTSAAVAVALIGALSAVSGAPPTPADAARRAHRLEVERLGLQSGVQDQLASAFGGVNFIEITEYPEAVAEPLEVPDEALRELDRRLVVVFVGRHVSSAVHERVISELAGEGRAAPRLQVLRELAGAARAALTAGDLDAFAGVMRGNTDAQRSLHSALVSADADRVIAVAQRHGAVGSKVNGAGGDGGSITVFGPADAARHRALLAALGKADPGWQLIAVRVSRSGLRVWESDGSGRHR